MHSEHLVVHKKDVRGQVGKVIDDMELVFYVPYEVEEVSN